MQPLLLYLLGLFNKTLVDADDAVAMCLSWQEKPVVINAKLPAKLFAALCDMFRRVSAVVRDVETLIIAGASPTTFGEGSYISFCPVFKQSHNL